MNLQPGGAPVLEQDPAHVRVDQYLEVGPAHRGLEVGVVAAVALAVAVRELAHPGALEGLPVVVRLRAEAAGARCLDEGVGRPARVAVGRDHHRPVAAARRVAVVAQPALLGLEHRGDVAPAPAARARADPALEIGGVAPLVDLRIHVRRAAEHAAARGVDAHAARAGLRFAFQVPVQRSLEELGESGRDRHEAAGRLTAGLDQQHLAPAGAGERLGQHAARRPRTHDDDVEHAPLPGKYPIDRAARIPGTRVRWRRFRAYPTSGACAEKLSKSPPRVRTAHW